MEDITPPKRAPWERQPGETTRAHEAFRRYLEMGAQRSLAKVVKAYEEDAARAPADAHAATKGLPFLKKWSRKYNWVARVEAWENAQDQEWEQERKRSIREAARRHTTIARGLTSKVVARLRALNAEELTTADIAKWLDIAVKVERLSLGMSTSTIGGTGEGGRFDININEAAEQIIRKLGAELADVEEAALSGEPEPE